MIQIDSNYVKIFFDSAIEVSSGEYGDFNEKMVAAVDNGRLECWEPREQDLEPNTPDSLTPPPLQTPLTSPPLNQVKVRPSSYPSDSLLELESEPASVRTHQYKYRSSAWTQFRILFYRMMLQTWRDAVSQCFPYVLHDTLSNF